MNAKFIGGPYSGRKFTHETLNRVGHLILVSWMPRTLMMPPLHLFAKFQNAGKDRCSLVDLTEAYEQRRRPDGTVEFHYASHRPHIVN